VSLPARCGLVAVVGRPNVGKSTLTNLLVGEKVTIVAEIPQTTRNIIRGIRTLPSGQIVVMDTPGIHKPRHLMNRLMVDTSAGAMRAADLILFLIEPDGFGPADRAVLDVLPAGGPPVLLVINKVDRVRREALLPLIARTKDLFPFAEVLLISALTGENTGGLAEKLLAHLPEGSPAFPPEEFTDRPERFLASEIIREKILHHTRQEIPHETCVMIDAFETTSPTLTKIEASILVEKESQKKIVIGREGSLLKAAGTEAREELEKLLGCQVFLKLWVSVREGWRDDAVVLRRLEISSGG